MVSDDDGLFSAAAQGARPLRPGARDRVQVGPSERGRGAVKVPSDASPLEVTTVANRVTAASARLPLAQRDQLAEGRMPIEARLDLHGMDTANATRALQQFLRRARRDRARCVLIIHGRGARSGGFAVLRDHTHELLAGPLASLTLGFATALPKDGGTGATYVMVKP
jgi:DNA-nicking Smr family endonuclease